MANANGKTDKANYHWREEATNDFDLVYDSNKIESWGPDNPNIFFWSGDKITSLQQEPETETVKVGYSSYTQGEVELSLEHVTTFSEIILEDTYLDEGDEDRFTHIMVEPYTFTSTTDDRGRFVLHLNKHTLSEVEDRLENTKIYTNNSKVYLSFTDKVSVAKMIIYDLQGRQVKSIDLKNNQSSFEIETNLTGGVYILEITANGNQLNKTVLLQ